ncbi:MAG: dihydropteroate synthase [Candidatus Sumerlaeia bacterium]|nr:dihydropteroate synthase [Candidatus Sumerlaeia bacterium]
MTTFPPQQPQIMAILNVSPESFFQGSVARTQSELLQAAERALKSGADWLDVGAMSTAPYKETRITEEEEARRMGIAVTGIVREFPGVRVSADTSRLLPARAALESGATLLNDVHGLHQTPELGPLAAEFSASVCLMANESQWDGVAPQGSEPVEWIVGLLKEAVKRAENAAIPSERLILDPGIGFFRKTPLPWYEVDLALIRGLDRVVALGYPVLVSVSRKSFLGKLLDREKPEERLAGSLAATLTCLQKGAAIIRTHDVAETKDVLRWWGLA